MQRRNFLIGAAGTAIGSSALVGSGAFTSVQADRDVTVGIADDANAYLGLEAGSGPTADKIVSTVQPIQGNGNIIELDFSDLGSNNGKGINKRATTRFENVLKVTNQGTNTVYLWVPAPQDSQSGNIGDGYIDRANRNRLLATSGNLSDSEMGNDVSQAGEEVTLATGQYVELTFEFETEGGSRVGEFSSPITFSAKDEVPTDPDDWEVPSDVLEDPYDGTASSQLE